MNIIITSSWSTTFLDFDLKPSSKDENKFFVLDKFEDAQLPLYIGIH